MFIWKETGLRGPAYPDSTPYTAPDGTQCPRTPRELLQEIADPVPPADFSDETYYRTEQDEAPYVVFTRKSDEMIAALNKAKLDAKLKLVRGVREGILNRLAGIAFAAQLSGDTATATAFVSVRQGLLDITTDLTDHATVEAEVMARYAAIVAQCTPAMVSAFAQVDA